MKAPFLYWVCLAYLIVLVGATDYAVIDKALLGSVPSPYNIIAALIVGAYNIGTLALLLRSRITVPAFLAGFAIGLAGIGYAIAKTGLGPGFHSASWIATRSAAGLIMGAIVFYCYRLTKRGFLK